MKTIRLIVIALLLTVRIGFAQTVSPTNMLATYNAAQAFFATLSTSQSNALIYTRTLTNSEAASNLPLPLATRNGSSFSNLTSVQIAAELNVLTNALGTNGGWSGAWLVSQMRYADNWTSLYTNTPTALPFTYTNASATNMDQFFRVLLGP